jgi:hypothetical protein
MRVGVLPPDPRGNPGLVCGLGDGSGACGWSVARVSDGYRCQADRLAQRLAPQSYLTLLACLVLRSSHARIAALITVRNRTSSARNSVMS